MSEGGRYRIFLGQKFSPKRLRQDIETDLPGDFFNGGSKNAVLRSSLIDRMSSWIGTVLAFERPGRLILD